MKNEIEKIVREALEIPKDIQIPDDYKFKSHPQYDSLTETIIVSNLNDHYRIKLDFSQFSELVNDVNDIVALVNKLLDGDN